MFSCSCPSKDQARDELAEHRSSPNQSKPAHQPRLDVYAPLAAFFAAAAAGGVVSIVAGVVIHLTRTAFAASSPAPTHSSLANCRSGLPPPGTLPPPAAPSVALLSPEPPQTFRLDAASSLDSEVKYLVRAA